MIGKEEKVSKKRRVFTPELKEEAARSVVESPNASVASVARELGVNEQTLRNWVNAYRKEHAGEEPPLTVSERARLRELEAEVRELRMKSEFLVGDITYIPTRAGWAYLATVIDCYSKAVLGYALADHMRAEIVCRALEMAARNHRLRPGCIFHSDHGVQYTSESFANTCKRLNIRRSMGRTGVCWDNAMAESFNAALKVERVHRVTYIDHKSAYHSIAQYIESATPSFRDRVPHPTTRPRRVQRIQGQRPIRPQEAYPESIGPAQRWPAASFVSLCGG